MPDASDLLFALSHVHDRDANAAVIVLLDPRVPLDEIGNVDGAATKAQLTNVRYFILNNETGYRWEIKMWTEHANNDESTWELVYETGCSGTPTPDSSCWAAALSFCSSDSRENGFCSCCAPAKNGSSDSCSR